MNFWPEPVGIGKYSGELSNWLALRGHEVRVICAPPYFPAWRVESSYRNWYSTDNIKSIKIFRCPLWVPRKPSSLSRLFHLASFAISSVLPILCQVFWKPDVIVTFVPAFFCAPNSLLLNSLTGNSSITWLHIQDFELDAAFELGMLRGQRLRVIAELLERLTLRRFSRVSSISSSMVNRLECKGVGSSRTFLFPNWVDLKVIYPQIDPSRKHNPYRQELGITSEKLVLMYTGSMNKKQGLEVLVEAIRQLVDFPQVVWLFGGGGPGRADFMRATECFSNVFHLPLQPSESLNDFLNAADIHLLPQKAGVADLVLPSKLLGMLASGRPVVATSTPGSELAELASEAGVCTAPGDADAFADALRHLIAHPGQRLMAGKRARRLAEEHFGKEAVLKRFEQQLLSLVESRRI